MRFSTLTAASLALLSSVTLAFPRGLLRGRSLVTDSPDNYTISITYLGISTDQVMQPEGEWTIPRAPLA
jgi:hypothetical protein